MSAPAPRTPGPVPPPRPGPERRRRCRSGQPPSVTPAPSAAAGTCPAHRPPGQDAARDRRHRDHPLHPARGPGRRPDVRHRHHPGRGLHLGRDAIGVEFEDRWAQLAAANITCARRQGATGTAEVIRGDARRLPGLLPPGTAGRVALVVTSPALRAHRPRAGQRRETRGGRRGRTSTTTATATTRPTSPSQGLGPARRVHPDPRRLVVLLRPGGPAWSPPGRGGSTASWSTCPAPCSPPARTPGLVPAERCVALLAGLAAAADPPPVVLPVDNVRRPAPAASPGT